MAINPFWELSPRLRWRCTGIVRGHSSLPFKRLCQRPLMSQPADLTTHTHTHTCFLENGDYMPSQGNLTDTRERWTLWPFPCLKCYITATIAGGKSREDVTWPKTPLSLSLSVFNLGEGGEEEKLNEDVVGNGREAHRKRGRKEGWQGKEDVEEKSFHVFRVWSDNQVLSWDGGNFLLV